MKVLFAVLVCAVFLWLIGSGRSDDAYSHIAKRETQFVCEQSPASLEAESRKSGKKLRLLCEISKYSCTRMTENASGKACYRYNIKYTMNRSEKRQSEKAERLLAEEALKRPKRKRAEYIYRRIIRNLKRDTKRRQSYAPYGALVLKRACCEGASLAFADVCQMSGLECHVIIGKSEGESHMWTALKQNSSWIYCDPAWDAGQTRLAYFARSASYMRDHAHVFPNEKS
jgi:transglutaminase/protease-like cytokinesis protein 3